MTPIAATDAGSPPASVRRIGRFRRSLGDELLTLAEAAADVRGGLEQVVSLSMREGGRPMTGAGARPRSQPATNSGERNVRTR